MAIASTRTRLGDQFSEGARLMWKAMEERSWSQGQMAKAIVAKPGVVPRWLYGDTKPSWDWAVKLRDVFGIALEAWTQEPAEPFIPPAARDESGPLPAEESSDSVVVDSAGGAPPASNGTEG